MGQTGHGSKMDHFKGVKNGFGSIGLQVGSGRVDLYFPHDLKKKKIYKENNMYFPFEKLSNKLFDVKCIILNSPLISIMNPVKFINIYSIILKLYKS